METPLILKLRLGENPTCAAVSNLDGVDRLLRIVNGWSDQEWMKICGRTAINVPVEDTARLFWALGKPEAKEIKDILRSCVPMFEVEDSETGKVKPVAFLQGILAWEHGKADIVDLRLRAILQGLKYYVEEFKMAWAFRKMLQPLVENNVNTVIAGLKTLRMRIESQREIEFPIETDKKPPPIIICVAAILKRFAYIIEYIGRVPWPPVMHAKFGTITAGSNPVWHPNLSVVLSSIIFKIREDVSILNDASFQYALLLSVWLLGMAGEAPFADEKINELFAWDTITQLLEVNFTACRTFVEYRFG